MARKRKPDKVYPVRFQADFWDRIVDATKKVAEAGHLDPWGPADFIRQATSMRVDQVENGKAA